MDNFHIDITSEGKEALDTALKLAMRYTSATHFAVREAQAGERHEAPEGFKYPHMLDWKYGKAPKPFRLVLYWSGSENTSDVQPLLFPLTKDNITDFVWSWLSAQDYGREPNHDGHNGKGWRVYCEGWGHVDNHWSAFVAISPTWAMYGK